MNSAFVGDYFQRPLDAPTDSFKKLQLLSRNTTSVIVFNEIFSSQSLNSDPFISLLVVNLEIITLLIRFDVYIVALMSAVWVLRGM